jgi:methionyl-tRNA formyltransferase
MEGKTYLVVGCKPWNRRLFSEIARSHPGRWEYLDALPELTVSRLRELRPRYVFFLHWSWKVPEDITREFECVCFHMTDVPFGRGGSPLQNLIARGHRRTKLTALRMTRGMDEGPVYGKEELSLEGNAEEIYIRAGELSARMLGEIAAREPEPVPQTGTPVEFKRRKPEESRMPASATLGQTHDHIRMLDADGYPPAFLDHQGFRYSFRRSALYDGRIVADVTITPLEEGQP